MDFKYLPVILGCLLRKCVLRGTKTLVSALLGPAGTLNSTMDSSWLSSQESVSVAAEVCDKLNWFSRSARSSINISKLVLGAGVGRTWAARVRVYISGAIWFSCVETRSQMYCELADNGDPVRKSKPHLREALSWHFSNSSLKILHKTTKHNTLEEILKKEDLKIKYLTYFVVSTGLAGPKRSLLMRFNWRPHVMLLRIATGLLEILQIMGFNTRAADIFAICFCCFPY